jgi:hypothetical protein
MQPPLVPGGIDISLALLEQGSIDFLPQCQRSRQLKYNTKMLKESSRTFLNQKPLVGLLNPEGEALGCGMVGVSSTDGDVDDLGRVGGGVFVPNVGAFVSNVGAEGTGKFEPVS